MSCFARIARTRPHGWAPLAACHRAKLIAGVRGIARSQFGQIDPSVGATTHYAGLRASRAGLLRKNSDAQRAVGECEAGQPADTKKQRRPSNRPKRQCAYGALPLRRPAITQSSSDGLRALGRRTQSRIFAAMIGSTPRSPRPRIARKGRTLSAPHGISRPR
jgi:hypothetical protein